MLGVSRALEGLVANKLSDLLDEYIENLNRDDLKISAGDINLRGGGTHSVLLAV